MTLRLGFVTVIVGRDRRLRACRQLVRELVQAVGRLEDALDAERTAHAHLGSCADCGADPCSVYLPLAGTAIEACAATHPDLEEVGS